MRTERRRIAAENRGAQLESGLSLERPRARGHFVQHDAQRPDVARHLRHVSAQLLRRHVRQRAHDGPDLRQRALGLRDGQFSRRHTLRQPEVQHLHAPVRRHDHVGAFQIAVHHAALVRMRQRSGELRAVTHHVLDPQRARRHLRAQRLPFDQFHGDVGLAVGLANLVNRADVRMVEARGGPRLTDQAGTRGRIVEARRREHLDRHVAVEPLVAGAIDLAHPAGANLPDDSVVSQPLTCGQRRRGRGQGRHHLERPDFRQGLRGVGSTQQRFDLAIQLGVAGAGFGQERGALTRIAPQRVVKNARDLLPAIHSGTFARADRIVQERGPF